MRTSKANADGRREDLRLLVGAFARAVEDLRAATEPAAADRVVPLGPHQADPVASMRTFSLAVMYPVDDPNTTTDFAST